MKSSYDAIADALYLRFTEIQIAESEEGVEDVILDFDAEGLIVGVEVLSASQRLAKGAV